MRRVLLFLALVLMVAGGFAYGCSLTGHQNISQKQDTSK